jgi:L-asparaginase
MHNMAESTNILLIYTGGTIGMVQDVETGQFRPFDFSHLYKHVPEIKKFDVKINAIAIEKPIDSSNMNPSVWINIATIIEENYEKYDGFVILHGSDTMAYSASALSFMLQGLNTPVILTGSQLPIGMIRTDGKENLITAIEIAAAKENGIPLVPEVAIYFEYQLFRGNRTHKYNAEHFDAFEPPNYPVLAEAGVNINYTRNAILPYRESDKLTVHTNLITDIAVLKLFPGITEKVVRAVLDISDIKAVILETFGSGNASSQAWFISLIKNAVQKGVVIYNVTQCNQGSVIQGRYETSAGLKDAGVISGYDITTEAAIAKLMFLLGKNISVPELKELLSSPMRGELTVQDY